MAPPKGNRKAIDLAFKQQKYRKTLESILTATKFRDLCNAKQKQREQDTADIVTRCYKSVIEAINTAIQETLTENPDEHLDIKYLWNNSKYGWEPDLFDGNHTDFWLDMADTYSANGYRLYIKTREQEEWISQSCTRDALDKMKQTDLMKLSFVGLTGTP